MPVKITLGPKLPKGHVPLPESLHAERFEVLRRALVTAYVQYRQLSQNPTHTQTFKLAQKKKQVALYELAEELGIAIPSNWPNEVKTIQMSWEA